MYYMNRNTGSIDTREGWCFTDENGRHRDPVGEGNPALHVLPECVVRNAPVREAFNGDLPEWAEAMNLRVVFYCADACDGSPIENDGQYRYFSDIANAKRHARSRNYVVVTE